ncbi:alcohol dehydrogenase [Candidatus Tenderia electrophaga]|jgi:dTDP-glucose pyrophosphorylase|uniref:Alcohol dehydrogenase n=1 Tax=Candidatus Tenderia electrophaga TaxID=1748243 RepID=A0A0S2TBV6_9GAMM|nr:alcohol dehydrogenase [Candidatus Tenderia electrophaga]
MTKTWRDVALDPQVSVKDAMAVLDAGSLQIALVVEADGHLAGTVTDGDIRRALLRGKGLDTSIHEVMNANPVTGLAEESRAIWQRTMQRHSLRHLPLLDSAGCVVDLVRFQTPSEPRRDTPVVIMAGGLGARLRPLTQQIPKPLIQVGSKPVLQTIIENFAEQGFEQIHLCINYKGEMIRKHFGDGSRFGVNIQYIEENERLGTAGALSLLPERPTRPFIVMNGDLLTKVDFVRLLEFHEQQAFTATMAMREYSHQIPYGVLKISDGYRLESLVEKPTERFYVNAGIYILDPTALDHLPQNQYFDMPGLFQKLMAEDKPAGCFPLRDYWIDIGRIEDLERAGAEFGEMFG